MKVLSQQYGKGRVRVMKVLQDGPVHTVKELTVKIMLGGPAFDASYSAADNSMVVPTDTMKNTVNCLAYDHLGTETEEFAVTLAKHFLTKYDHVKKVALDIDERVWARASVDGTPHPHTFSQAQAAVPTVKLEMTESSSVLESGIKDLLLLKSTEAGFAGYPKCEFTTLKETTNRIVATSLAASWTWEGKPNSYHAANAVVLQSLLKPFAEKFSVSVQANLWDMGTLALANVPEISKIRLAAPNKHYLWIDLTAFDRKNDHTLFLPTDEPHGQIEVTMGRD